MKKFLLAAVMVCVSVCFLGCENKPAPKKDDAKPAATAPAGEVKKEEAKPAATAPAADPAKK